MVDFSKAFHTGVLVENLAATMDFYSRSFGTRWAKPVHTDAMQLWTPERGIHTISLSFTYSAEGPQHLEIQRGSAGSFYDPALSTGHHIGIWSEDIPGDTAALLALGWTVVAAGNAPENGYGRFIYFKPPGAGMMVELASTTIRPGFEQWWAGGDLQRPQPSSST